MSEEHDPQPNPAGETPPDPLGIIGWVIGGKYRIQAYVGGGGFGEVYSSCNVNLTEQRLIIKFFKRVQAREKFAKEAKILCMLDHPNICRVMDFLPDEGAVVVAFIDGRDGAKILKESGLLAPDLFMKVARALTDAMTYAHEKRIAHRDIKPGNIIIDKSEHVYLIDFGIAKEIGGDATKTGYQTLTPMFAAPERQAGDRDYNPFISDVYETGITLFNFITGSLPYRNPVNPNYAEWGGTAAEKLSPALRRILMKATHPDPRKRYQTMAELAADINTLESVYGSSRKKSSAIYIAAAVLVIAAAVAGWQYFGGRSETAQTEPKQQPVPAESKKPEAVPPKPPAETPSVKPQTTPAVIPPRTDSAKLNVQPYRPASQTAKPETKPESKPVTKPETKPETPVRTENKQETAEPPAPAPMAGGTFQITPRDNTVVMLDGASVNPGGPFEVKPGTHTIAASHPNYPIYRTSATFEAGGSNTVTIDLPQVYAGAEKVDLQVALAPPSDKHMLELTFNGHKQTLTKFPALGLQQLSGDWNVVVRVVSAETGNPGRPRVDSCIAYPYGGGPRFSLKGDRGVIRLGGNPGNKITSCPIVIYWSEQ